MLQALKQAGAYVRGNWFFATYFVSVRHSLLRCSFFLSPSPSSLQVSAFFSSSFGHAQWQRLHTALGHSDVLTMFVAAALPATAAYWLYSAVLAALDARGALRAYKVQPHNTTGQWNRAAVLHALPCVAFNSLVLGLPVSLLSSWLQMHWLGGSASPATLPSFGYMLLQLLVCPLVTEVVFFHSHRALHSPVSSGGRRVFSPCAVAWLIAVLHGRPRTRGSTSSTMSTQRPWATRLLRVREREMYEKQRTCCR